MADFSRLPGPNADLWDWQLRGLCRGKDNSLFFHPEGERGAARSSREMAAKEICMNCPVQIPCADHALKVREPYGVWGGMTEEEREEHHARQKALARAQAAREKEARARQAKLKEKLLREKALQNEAKEAASATDAAPREPAPRRKRPVGGTVAVAAPKTKAADTNAPKKSPSKPAARKKPKTLVKA
jgi:WhiB family redox-sensing transcriptional regulator